MSTKVGWLTLFILALGGVSAWRPLHSSGQGATAAEALCSRMRALPPPTYQSFYGRQEQVEGQSGEWLVRLAGWEPSNWPPEQFTFSVKNEQTLAKSRFTLSAWGPPHRSLQFNQIVQIDPLAGNRALLLGLAGAGFSEADVVSLPSGQVIDSFSCFDPVVSPGRLFLAFLKSFPGHPGPVSISDEYLVYDLRKSPGYSRPRFKAGVTYEVGWPVYPPGATNAAGENLVQGLGASVHSLSSGRLFWLDQGRLAFTDHYPGETRLVVVNLSGGIRSAAVRAVNLEASAIVDLRACRKVVAPSDYDRWSKDPAGLIRVNLISLLTAQPDVVCLHFVSGPCVKREELTLRLP